MSVVWKQMTTQYMSGEDATLGRWKIGAAFYNGTRPRNDPNKYTANILLPGMKHDLGSYATIAEAKARVEEAVQAWLECAGLNK